MSIISLVMSLVAILFSSAAFAAGETVACGTHKTGDLYAYSKTDFYGKKTTQLLKVEGVDGDSLSVVNHAGQTMVLDKMFNVFKGADGRTFTPKYYSRLECPFALGETKTYPDVTYPGASPGAEVKATFTVTVDPEFTTVTVPAGTFKVVRIVSKNNYFWKNGTNNGTGYGEFVSYYSPQLGVSVKNETFDRPSRGNASKDQSELTEYSGAK